MWGCGSGSPHKGASSPCWDTGTQAHEIQLHTAAQALCSELQTAAPPSRVLVTSSAGGTLGTAAMHPKLTSVTEHAPLSAWEGEEMQIKRCGNQRDPLLWVLTLPWLPLPHFCGISSVNLCFVNWQKSFLPATLQSLGYLIIAVSNESGEAGRVNSTQSFSNH